MRSYNLFLGFRRLCEDWRDLARQDGVKGFRGYGRCVDDFRYYRGYVECYVAEKNDHTTVRIGDFEVSFHAQPEVSFRLDDYVRLPEALQKGRELLQEELRIRANATWAGQPAEPPSPRRQKRAYNISPEAREAKREAMREYWRKTKARSLS